MASRSDGGVIRGAPQNLTDLLRESRDARGCAWPYLPRSDDPGSPHGAPDAEVRFVEMQLPSNHTRKKQVVAVGPYGPPMPVFNFETSASGTQDARQNSDWAARQVALHAEMQRTVCMIGDTLRTEVEATRAELQALTAAQHDMMEPVVSEIQRVKSDTAMIWNRIKNYTSPSIDDSKAAQHDVVEPFVSEIRRVKSDTAKIIDEIRKVQSDQTEELKGLHLIWNGIKSYTSPSIDDIKSAQHEVVEPFVSEIQRIKSDTSMIWNRIKSYTSPSIDDIKSAQHEVMEPLVPEIQRVKSDTAMIWNRIKDYTSPSIDDSKAAQHNVGEPSDTAKKIDEMRRVQSGQDEELKTLHLIWNKITTHTSPSIDDIKAGMPPLAVGIKDVLKAVQSAEVKVGQILVEVKFIADAFKSRAVAKNATSPNASRSRGPPDSIHRHEGRGQYPSGKSSPKRDTWFGTYEPEENMIFR